MKHELFPVDELAPGEMRQVTVEGVSVLVARAPDGRIRALRDTCPHQQASLSKGRLEAMVVSRSVGDSTRGDGFVVRCPWHRFEFDLDTGRCLADPEKMRVRAYRTSVVDGKVVLER